MMSGRWSASVSSVMPHPSSTPGRKFSQTTSKSGIIRQNKLFADVGAEVERDPPLVEVDRVVDALGILGVLGPGLVQDRLADPGPEQPPDIHAAQSFDLHHVSPEEPQQLGRESAAPGLGEGEDANTVERSAPGRLTRLDRRG